MRNRTLVAGVTGASITALAAVGAVGALAAGAPSKVTVKESDAMHVKINRYIQQDLRWDKDVYNVRSGGTLMFLMNAPDEGPHTLTVVKAKDLPRTAAQINNCAICGKLAVAHGADPNSNTPPKFQFLENGVGTNTVPNYDRPGDSAFLPPVKGQKVSFKVTAKKGTVLHFLCLVHPWMQAIIKVG